MKTTTLFLLALLHLSKTDQITKRDAILGKWESQRNNLIVEVYKERNEYKAKVLWFKNPDEKTKPSDTWLDEKNPNKALRNRKILGMEVLQHLVYNAKEDRWEGGEIYDSTTGRTWRSSAWLTKDGLLDVRGYWHFEFIGQTMIFKRI